MNRFKSPPLLYYPDFYPDGTWLRSMLLLTDSIARIVPDDVVLNDPEALREIAGELGALTDVAPTESHILPIGYAADWLKRTFAIIGRETHREKKGRMRMSISRGGDTVGFAGRTLIYDRKLSQMVRDLLEEHGLIDYAAQNTVEKLFGRKTAIMVRTEAANAILSFIADNIARDLGYTAVTSSSLNFAMNSLSGLDIQARAPAGASEGLLASAFASVLVPREVGQIRFSDYRILREGSADLRVAFGGFVQKCHDSCRLGRIENTAHLQEKVAEAAKDLEREFARFQTFTSKALTFIKNWWPVGFVGLLYCAKDFIPVEYALSAREAAAGAIGLKLLERAEKVLAFGADDGKRKVFSLSAELGGNIRALPCVLQLLEERS